VHLRPTAHAAAAASAPPAAWHAAHLAKDGCKRVLPAKHLREERLRLVARERSAARHPWPAIQTLLSNLIVEASFFRVGEHLIRL